MGKGGKTIAQMREENLNFDRDLDLSIAAHAAATELEKEQTPALLISEYNTLTTFDETESKRFAEHMKPTRARIQGIKNLLLATLNERNEKSVKTDFGTAYKSTIVTSKITDKIKFLDWALEDWDNRGAMLQIGAPQKSALDSYMDDNEGSLPPFVETSSFTCINIKAS